MTVEIKICGLRTSEAMTAALEAGADYVGLVFYPRSPRNVTLAEARPLADQARGSSRIVALVVDADDALIAEIVHEIRPDLLQLHGSETPQRVDEIKARHTITIMKAIKVATKADAETARGYLGHADLILFDAKPPKDRAEALPGGNGIAFDWTAIEEVAKDVPYMLSGGLTPENVATALAITGASRIDVSSGVESAPGVKDPNRIRAFIAAARQGSR